MNTTKRQSRPTINQLQAQAEALEQQARALTKQLQLARGTREIAPAEDPDNVPTRELCDVVAAMIRERPMQYAEIITALPAVNPNRIKGVMTQLRRDDIGMINLGTESRAIYFIPDPEVLTRLKAAVKGR